MYSFFFLHYSNILRKYCILIANYKYFERIIFVIIIISSLNILAETFNL